MIDFDEFVKLFFSQKKKSQFFMSLGLEHPDLSEFYSDFKCCKTILQKWCRYYYYNNNCIKLAFSRKCFLDFNWEQ